MALSTFRFIKQEFTTVDKTPESDSITELQIGPLDTERQVHNVVKKAHEVTYFVLFFSYT